MVEDLFLKWDAQKEAKGKHGKFDHLWLGPFQVVAFQDNILKFVIDIPLHDKIFYACFWTSCVAIVNLPVSSSLLLINDDLYICCMINY
jgi:hypothetical protein